MAAEYILSAEMLIDQKEVEIEVWVEIGDKLKKQKAMRPKEEKVSIKK